MTPPCWAMHFRWKLAIEILVLSSSPIGLLASSAAPRAGGLDEATDLPLRIRTGVGTLGAFDTKLVGLVTP